MCRSARSRARAKSSSWSRVTRNGSSSRRISSSSARELAPGAVGVLERDLRVEPRRALVPAPVRQRPPVVEDARLEDAVQLDALERPVEAEPPRRERQRVAEDPEVLALAHLLREEAEHRLRRRRRLRQEVEEVGQPGEPVEVAADRLEHDLLVVGVVDVDVEEERLAVGDLADRVEQPRHPALDERPPRVSSVGGPSAISMTSRSPRGPTTSADGEVDAGPRGSRAACRGTPGRAPGTPPGSGSVPKPELVDPARATRRPCASSARPRVRAGREGRGSRRAATRPRAPRAAPGRPRPGAATCSRPSPAALQRGELADAS